MSLHWLDWFFAALVPLYPGNDTDTPNVAVGCQGWLAWPVELDLRTCTLYETGRMYSTAMASTASADVLPRSPIQSKEASARAP
jgi:hypothetical protein